MIYRLITILVVLLLACTSCMERDNLAEKRAVLAKQSHGDILVGAVAPWSKIDSLLWAGLELAMDEINDAGGILGRRIRVVKRDDEGKLKKGIQIAQEFADNPNIVAVIGHYQPFVTIPASVIYQYYGILLLSTVVTDPKLTREGFSLVFRTVPDDNAFCARLNTLSARKGLNQFLLYHDSTVTGRSLADAFEIATEQAGITILDQQSYNRYTTVRDFKRILTLWKQSYSFEAIFVAGGLPKAGLFIKTARNMGVNQPILGGLVLDDKKLLPILGNKVSDVFVPTTFDPDSQKSQVQKFVKDFKKRYGRIPLTLAAQGYDTVHALAEAIKQAGSTSPPAMAKALLSGKGFQGLTGPVYFDAQGKRLATNIGIKEVKNGQFVHLHTKDK